MDPTWTSTTPDPELFLPVQRPPGDQPEPAVAEGEAPAGSAQEQGNGFVSKRGHPGDEPWSAPESGAVPEGNG